MFEKFGGGKKPERTESITRAEYIRESLKSTPFGEKFPDLVKEVADVTQKPGTYEYKVTFRSGDTWELCVPFRFQTYGRPETKIMGQEEGEEINAWFKVNGVEGDFQDAYILSEQLNLHHLANALDSQEEKGTYSSDFKVSGNKYTAADDLYGRLGLLSDEYLMSTVSPSKK